MTASPSPSALELAQAIVDGKPAHRNIVGGVFVRSSDGERLARALIATAKKLECVKAVQYTPTGDNHHNAWLCPYCNPDRKTMEALQRRAEEAEAERDAIISDMARLREGQRTPGFDECCPLVFEGACHMDSTTYDLTGCSYHRCPVQQATTASREATK